MTRLYVWITAGLTGIIGLLIGIIINGSPVPPRVAAPEQAGSLVAEGARDARLA